MTSLTGHLVPQVDPPRSPREALPTMYDLPSEFPEEPGLPDEFHDIQPQLLSRTLHLVDCAADNRFTGTDLNIYYDVHHQIWHKRPDWFLSIDVPRLYDGHDSRRSYVVWQEGRSPEVVVEFLSPRTEKEDLGRFYEDSDRIANDTVEDFPGDVTEAAAVAKTTSPDKLTVYEQYLRVPHYMVYSRYTQKLRYFKLNGRYYEEQPVQQHSPMIWLPDLKIGLGLWNDYFEGLPGPWLRWCDSEGNWLLTDTEQERTAKEAAQEQVTQAQREAEQAQKRATQAQREAEQAQREAEQAQKEARKLAQKLKDLGINPDEL